MPASRSRRRRCGWAGRTTRRSRRRCSSLAPTGRVPLLIDDGFAIWDSLAIAETLAERFPDKRLWPRDPKQRARARSLCAEMHSGFGELRSTFGMNLEARAARDRRAHAAREARRGARPEADRRDVERGARGERRSLPVRRLQHRRRLLRAGLHPRAHLRPAAVAAKRRATRSTSSPCRPSSSGSARPWPSTTGSPRTSRTASAPERGLPAAAARRKRAEARFFVFPFAISPIRRRRLRRRDMKPTAARPATISA